MMAPDDRFLENLIVLLAITAFVLAFTACGPSLTDLIREDPCYTLTIDTTFVPHDSTYAWMGEGGCDGVTLTTDTTGAAP